MGEPRPEIIRGDPYCLLPFPGIGFGRADAMYLDLGLDPGAIRRQALCAWYAVYSDNDGHIWYPIEFAVAAVRGKVHSAALNPQAALLLAVEEKRLAVRRDTSGNYWVADFHKAATEQRIAELLAAALAEGSLWKAVWAAGEKCGAWDRLSEHQRTELHKALFAELNSPIVLLTGSPGTGKTYTAAALAEAILAYCGEMLIALGAPRGRPPFA